MGENSKHIGSVIKDKLFSRYTLAIVILGLAVNYFGAQLALYFGWPVFLDSIGTILTAALGGMLPGILVGYFSNVLNSFSDPITLYYGIINVLIAIVTVYLSKSGAFKKIGKAIVGAILLALIGGIIGSLLTWMLYGLNFGDGISADMAASLYNNAGISKFWAQLTADFAIDIADKLITVAIVFVVLKYLPRRFLEKLPLGYVYYREVQGISKKEGRSQGVEPTPDHTAAAVAEFAEEIEENHEIHYIENKAFYSRRSLRKKMVSLVVATVMILGTLAVTIGYIMYQNAMNQRYIETCRGTVKIMMEDLDGDKITKYMTTGKKDADYAKTEARMQELCKNVKSVEYMYVYQIKKDGCHVVFDLDTKDVKGAEMGEVVPFEKSFEKYVPDLLKGKKIDPVISSGNYGWLLTVYEPILDSNKKCVAYAAADIPMADIIKDRFEFIIRVISLLFGASIILIAIAIYFAEKKMVLPINAMTVAASRFSYDNEQERQKNLKTLGDLNINTGDEIERLYTTMYDTFEKVTNYIDTVAEQNSMIAQMQNSIILSFADMVESRDKNTGSHIKRTAAYVKAISRAMYERGDFPEILTEEYLENVTKSAPLHDIGKIKIPDQILNKPGKLTDEEFDVIKTHTTAGGEILEQTMEGIEGKNYLTIACEMAKYHHEKWDGKGYPTGISGASIPLCARIMAVADVFDALISTRSYKGPFPFDKALDIIKKDAGTHFDPVVVQAFLSIEDEIRELSKKE